MYALLFIPITFYECLYMCIEVSFVGFESIILLSRSSTRDCSKCDACNGNYNNV